MSLRSDLDTLIDKNRQETLQGKTLGTGFEDPA
jgi:hypothetical protein